MGANGLGNAVTGDPHASAPAGGPVTVAFANEGDFGAWHDTKRAELGIPAPGYDHEGNPAILEQWTTAVVEPRVIDGYWTVTLPADQVAADATLKSLEVLTVKYPSEPGSPVDANGSPISEIAVVPPEQFHAPIPATWTDPATGTVYDTTTGEPVA
jgi:hypothetical protein